jgi:hypothetical protein
MAVYYKVTPKQWDELNKNSKPRYMTKKERESLNNLYKQILTGVKS